MPSLKAVRSRIASVKATQKITRAMKMVAAAKLRRAQDAIVAARPYANALAEAVAEVAARAGADAHPLLSSQAEGKGRVALVVISSDRGLCGALNTGICRTTQRFVEEQTKAGVLTEAQLQVVGRKGRDYFKRRSVPIAHELNGVTGDTAIERAKEIALLVSTDFLEGRVDSVYLVFNEFKSAVSQKPICDQLLPIKTPVAADNTGGLDFLYEPSKLALLSAMLPLYLQNQIFKALLESIASEFGARMSAMESATTNANDMIDRLTLLYNRSRQASITKELMEIVGGAEALKG